MNRPVNPELIAALRKLRNDALNAGENTLGVMLAGVDLYLSLGREFELIEVMKKFADEMKGPSRTRPRPKTWSGCTAGTLRSRSDR